MTFSILIRDPTTGSLGGAAATGSLCVGGWVLRGRLGAGLSASQGAAPSEFWGTGVLDRMAAGETAGRAVAAQVAPDPNRDWRQLSALDPQGGTAAHSGQCNGAERGHVCRPDRVAAGNILTGLDTLDRLLDAYETTTGPVSARLLAALKAAQGQGGDQRGLKSAALLVLAADRPPLTLRVDWAEDPLAALEALHHRATSGDYADWTRAVPVAADPFRADAAIIARDSDRSPR